MEQQSKEEVVEGNEKRVKRPTIKAAIECLTILAKAYDIKFTITYVPKIHRYTQNPGWKIKIMDKSFYCVDSLILCAGKAVAFVYAAHENNSLTPDKKQPSI